MVQAQHLNRSSRTSIHKLWYVTYARRKSHSKLGKNSGHFLSNYIQNVLIYFLCDFIESLIRLIFVNILYKNSCITGSPEDEFSLWHCHCILDPVIENTNFCKYSKAFIVKATLRSKIPAEYTLQFTITINRGTLKNFAWMLISKTSHRMCYHIIISITTCFWVDGFWVNVSRDRRNQACWIMIYTVDWETNRLDVVIQCCRLVKSC